MEESPSPDGELCPFCIVWGLLNSWLPVSLGRKEERKPQTRRSDFDIPRVLRGHLPVGVSKGKGKNNPEKMQECPPSRQAGLRKSSKEEGHLGYLRLPSSCSRQQRGYCPLLSPRP